jgi:hypothetical protein
MHGYKVRSYAWGVHWFNRFAAFTNRRSAPLTMLRLQYGYLPARFMYAGAEHRVQRVEGSWEESGRPGMAARRCFRIFCCNGQRYTIAQNLQAGAWLLIDPPKEAKEQRHAQTSTLFNVV